MNLSTQEVYINATLGPLIYSSADQTLRSTVEQTIFEAAVILIGVVGALGNGIVLYVFCASKKLRKQDVNVLFINQLTLDLFACLWLVVDYSVKVANIYLKGPTGYWLCIFVLSDNFFFVGIFGSKFNLMSIAIERYVKIVHSIWHKNNFKSWMVYSAAVIPWAVGVGLSQSAASSSFSVVSGRCSVFALSTNRSVLYSQMTSVFIITFILPLASFLFCYSSIIFVVHHQAKIVASQRVVNPLAETANNTRDTRLEMNALKTMIIISVAFVIFWLPNDLYAAITLFSNNTIRASPLIRNVTIFITFVNICMNPFIYALKYDVVKKRLLKLMRVCSDDSKSENSTSIPDSSTKTTR